MQTDDSVMMRLISHFGSQKKIAKALNTDHSRVRYWKMRGFIPERNALKIERLDVGVSAMDVLLEAERVRVPKRRQRRRDPKTTDIVTGASDEAAERLVGAEEQGASKPMGTEAQAKLQSIFGFDR